MKSKSKIILTAFFLLGGALVFCPKKQASALSQPFGILTFQPAYSEDLESTPTLPLPDGVEKQANLLPLAAESIINTFPDFTYQRKSQDEIITSSDIREFGPRQIILWQGHGSWNEETSTITLRTGRDFSEEDYATDPIYKDDVDNGRIAREDWFYEGITSKYIDKYAGDLTGSIVYLGACDSAYAGNSTIADAFLAKGAAVVLGATYTLQTTYNDVMEYTFTKLLAEINPATGNYYTTGEALARAKELYGTDDGSPAHSEMIIFGDANYRIATTETTPTVPDTTENPNTGEHITFYIAVTAISLIGLIGVSLLIFEKIKR